METLDLKRQSIVVITGHGSGTDDVVQELLVNHQAGVPDGAIIGEAFRLVRDAGGLMNDGESESVNFYPVQSFKRVSFSVKKVQLASSFAIPH